jgi:hypothetical protein
VEFNGAISANLRGADRGQAARSRIPDDQGHLFKDLQTEAVSIMALSPNQPHPTELQSSISTINHANRKMLFNDSHHPEAERQLLLPRIKTLEEPGHDLIFYEENGSNLKGGFDGQMNTLFELPARILKLEQNIELLTQKVSSLEENRTMSSGKETARRIDKLKDLLKVYGGSQTFRQLQNDLSLSPSQFTRLVKCLDERCFEIRRSPNAQRGEKLLLLK